MKLSRLLDLLDNWAKWMKQDNHKLGYPSQINYFSTGGASTLETFNEMIDESEYKNIKIIDACIHSLETEQKKAIYAKWLNEKKPMYYDLKLDLAMDNLMTMLSRRIFA